MFSGICFSYHFPQNSSQRGYENIKYVKKFYYYIKYKNTILFLYNLMWSIIKIVDKDIV